MENISGVQNTFEKRVDLGILLNTVKEEKIEEKKSSPLRLAAGRPSQPRPLPCSPEDTPVQIYLFENHNKDRVGILGL